MEPATSPKSSHPRLRRLGLGVLTALVALAGFVLVILFFESRDSSDVGDSGGDANAPGQVVRDQQRPRTPARIGRDAVALTDDQFLHALELGDVVLVYGTPSPPPELRALQNKVSGPFDPVLAANGAAVVLDRRPGTNGVTAFAWRREQQAASPADPALERFADYWLGRAPGR